MAKNTTAAAAKTRPGFVAICRDESGKVFVAGVRASCLNSKAEAEKLAVQTAADPKNRIVAEVALPEGW